MSSEDTLDTRKANKEFVPNIRRRSKLRNSLSEFSVEPLEITERLSFEKFYLGISLTGSEADLYSKIAQASTRCAEIPYMDDNMRVNICIIITEIRETVTKKGNNPGQRMCFLKGGDGSYHLDSMVVFPQTFSKYERLLTPGRVLNVYGTTNGQGIIVNKIEVLK